MEESMTEELNEGTDTENSIIEPLEPDTEVEVSELDEEAELSEAEPDIEQDEAAESLEDDQTPVEEQTEPQQDQTEPSQPDEDVEITLESVVEAVLFSSDEPLTAARLANIVEATTKQVREHIGNLNKKYEENNNAFRIEQIAGGYQMLTLSRYNHWLKQLLRARSESKFSPAALETLAIIAYKQPVIRADIEAIRGVAVGEVIRSLSYKGLVKIVGRAEVLGRPMLYGTTKKFLEVFGLNTLKDLPKIEELKKPPN
jgi:segregation and condensation protein B